jgi:hypothetical protein
MKSKKNDGRFSSENEHDEHAFSKAAAEGPIEARLAFYHFLSEPFQSEFRK